MKNKYLILGFLIGLLLAISVYAEEKILATVGNEKITLADFKERLEELPPQFQGYYSSEKGKKKFLDQLIQERIFYLQAQEKGIEGEPIVKEAIERARKNIIVAYYVNKILQNVVISDKELQDYYEAHKDKYIAQERVRADHILVKTEPEALAIIKRLKAGEDFQALAKKESIAPNAQETADVDWFEKGQMVKPFEEAAFALNAGEISTPVKTQYGYHIIKVTDKKPQMQKSFETVKASIREELLRLSQNNKLDELVVALKKKTKVSVNEDVLNQF